MAPAGLSADFSERFFQFGLFPPVSSNGAGPGRTVNSVSINLVGGYNAGTRIFEIGSVWNASKEFTQGLQLAGMLNYSGHSCNSVQIGGMANVAASGSSPLQLAGLLNVGDEVGGVQLSALVNVARSLRGVQIGLVNYVEDGEEGVSVGLVNIVRRGGKYEFELSFSDAVNTLLSFRLGTDRFYTIFSGGCNYLFAAAGYAVGLGFGTSIVRKGAWSSQIEVQALGISRGKEFPGGSVNSIIQLRLPVCREISRHLKLFAGPAFNLGLQDPAMAAAGELAPWTLWKAQRGGILAEGWIGLAAGVRF